MDVDASRDVSTLSVIKKGPLEKMQSGVLNRSVWKQYTFILNKHTLRYINELTHESKEFSCADIVTIDYGTAIKGAQFPITIHFKLSRSWKMYIRAQSMEDRVSWVEAFKRIKNWTVSTDCLFVAPVEPLVGPGAALPAVPDSEYDCPTPPPTRHSGFFPPSPHVARQPSLKNDIPPSPKPEHRVMFPPNDVSSAVTKLNMAKPMNINTPPPSNIVDEFGYVVLPDFPMDQVASTGPFPLDDPNASHYEAPFEESCEEETIKPPAKPERREMLISELTKQITQSFTVEQVLGLTDMLSQVPNQGVKNHHYVNLEMLLEAVASKASDINLLYSDNCQLERPDWAKANADDFSIGKLVGTEVVAHISPASLTGKQKIGEGQFGDVFIATLHGESGSTEVAMKTYKGIHNSAQEEKFMKEMSRLSQLVHPNIVRMYGIVMEGEFPAMVMEYLPRSDLKTFLTKNGRPTPKLVKYMIDIAMAMNYVSEKGLVHRDLAARNVLVDDNELCKVGDFGLLRELPADCDIYVPQSDDPIPYRWLALESLTERRFSVASDVWSYGVLMWEMFKPTKVPFEEFGAFQLVSKLKDGYRLPLPRGIPQVLGSIMNACWKEDPSKRPSFLLICTLLTTKALMLKEEDYVYGKCEHKKQNK